MTYIILLVFLLIFILSSPAKIVSTILTLDFLPGALSMFDGKVYTHTLKPGSIEIVLNHIIAAFINIIDFLMICFCWISGVRHIAKLIYKSPDTIEKSVSFIFGGPNGHRNFMTHSVFNPIFLIYLFISSYICKLFINTPLDLFNRIFFFLIGLSFVCHLLADTMPKYWRGYANIKIFFFIHFTTLSPLISKSWLYINSILSLACLYQCTFLV